MIIIIVIVAAVLKLDSKVDLESTWGNLRQGMGYILEGST